MATTIQMITLRHHQPVVLGIGHGIKLEGVDASSQPVTIELSANVLHALRGPLQAQWAMFDLAQGKP